ncbi:twin-arginine translocase TatA/TatE family subunit [Agrobacterium vaccinii]|jgi:sec-independent protein translocase protein TatA|uniref:twin-arginine translocase TatA/TatE family subunit n=1 Tax=Agrobacterium vaccinii TaxID=2735528 RepID=UPI000DD066DD|nr:twin-arginine translocase TatA/TatE family subunit [Agrobacterium vaccinii]UHS56440.1 twin-arginine translocase TatA/TatE family subunit [Agrobacterium vaccinii]UHS61177.1 twin-arginine translocase TatA/TatE family subunit [Agrobacterium vaccinii]
MGSFSVWHWLIVLVIVLVLFGRGKIPELMGDVAKGIKSFKKGMADEDGTARPADHDTTQEPTTPVHPRTVDHKADELK